MNFKKLEILGFKSFADKLEVKFDSGITGIVGPNGCGKSNVADSIRWVLGEQSAKLLRGSQMMDVIFNGTEKRKSLSFCEVALHFDNSNRIFPVEYDEVVISRKLYRSGESEYCLNKNTCRLKDIVDLLRDAGIGREGYSIIGQGRIDELLSAKPEDRRSIFEEACGISKFKARRNETERKLGRTHDNLVRLNDILTEIDRQLQPLAAQSENAKVYLDLKEQLKMHETNNYICQYESISSTKKIIEDRLQAITEEYDARKSEYDQAVSEYEKLFEDINNTDKDINALRNNQLSITVGIEKQSGEINLLKERISMLTEQNRRLYEDLQEYDAQREKLLAGISLIEGNKAEKQSAHDKLLDESDALSTQFLSIVTMIATGEDEVEETQRKVIDSIQRLSEIKSNLSSLLTEKNVLADKQSDILKRTISLNRSIESDKQQKEKLLTEKAQLSRQKEEQISVRRQLLERYNAAVAKHKLNAGKISEGNTQISSLSTKLNYLSQSRDNFEGYNNSVKMLLSHAAKDARLAASFEGVVARLIDVPEKYESAIDVALGAAMQNIVTRTQEQAKHLINYLKENRLGRVTFLPMDAIKARDIDQRTVNAAAGCRGYLGVASEIISYDKQYYNIISGLLGKTIVCDNLDNAVTISKAINYSVKIVTLDGDIIHPYGAMTGGSKKSVVSNLLGYDREIKDTQESLDLARASVQTLTAEQQVLESDSQKDAAEIEAIGESINDNNIQSATVQEKIEKLNFSISALEAETAEAAKENDKVDARIMWINGELKTADELEAKISKQRDGADDSRVEQREKYDSLRKQRDKLHEQTTNIKVRLASLSAEISADRDNHARMSVELDETNIDIEKTKQQIELNKESVSQSEQAITEVKYDVLSEQQLQEIKDKLNNLDEYKYNMQKSMTAADRKKTELSASLHKISETRIKEENTFNKVEIDLDNMKDRIWEEYQITYESALTYRIEDYDFTKSNSEIQKLKRQINALGYVNVNAIEDYKSLKERYDELDSQIKDLEKAEEDLRKIIAELTEEMLARFTKGFNDIQANFTRVFRELFGGGNAKLVLDTTETEDPLSAGIEIVAEPPGKKLQSISLLSGGERALTAIAILFAILKLRPMPFCVLDEIEAALDDANALRFAKYLKNFSKETQFIVITHRKPTMELADALYGVTMQEKGVSKIVSVKLSEALSAAETA